MVSTLSGINNCNEYYTNHYYSSSFQEDVKKIISKIRENSAEDDHTPWTVIRRDIGRVYSMYHEKSQHGRSDEPSMIKDLAHQYIAALGYLEIKSSSISIEDKTIPVYAYYENSLGIPLLTVLLSDVDEEGNVLDGTIFTIDDYNNISTLPDCKIAVDDILFKQDTAPRWVMIIGLAQIVLIDRNRWAERRYLEFDLDEIFSRRDEFTFQTLVALLHSSSLLPPDGISPLESLLEESRKNASGVSQDLKYALRESIEILGNEVIYDQITRLKRDVENDSIDPSQLTIECLRYMYRMLFMLFIESRPELGYAPMNNMSYMQGYSLENLRDIADTVSDDLDSVADGYFLHETLSKLYSIIYSGYPDNEEELKRLQESDSINDIFVMEPLKAHIFDPEYTSMITSSKIRNSAMLKILDLMSITRDKKKKNSRRGRISYSALGINQMGAVYEALLSYRGFIASEKLYEVKREDEEEDALTVGYFVPESELDKYSEKERARNEDGSLRTYEKGQFVYRLAGREREKSASYYTPESLTKTLVKYSLKELLDGKRADEILQLTVCEPAMGSAAFLNEAINQLAEAYLERKQKELGQTISYEDYPQELQKVKMFIADKNVYGVDLNPIAVELAEVSLWLNTIFKGGYIPWFKTQLVNGNSLIGARRQCYTLEQVMTSKEPNVWYSNKPKRILPRQQRLKNKQIYHFFTGDPGMANYSDKVIKSLYPEQIKKINDWRKSFIKPLSGEEADIALNLSEVVDNLWKQQIKLRQKLEKETNDPLSVFGHEDNSESSHMTIREKDKIFREMYLSEEQQNAGPYARLKFAMDYWCSLWFWPIDKADLLPSRKEFYAEMMMILSGNAGPAISRTTNTIPVKNSKQVQATLFPTKAQLTIIEYYNSFEGGGQVDIPALCKENKRLQTVREIAKSNHFMHWELEFADLFDQRGGFDLVIGNPPWIKVEWKEQDILSEKFPSIAIKKMSAAKTGSIREACLLDANVEAQYILEYTIITGTQRFINSSQNYLELSESATNLYKCFLPISWYIAVNDGYCSFLHPNGVFDESNSNVLRKIIYQKLQQHYSFENEYSLFQDVGHRLSFSLNIYKNRTVKDNGEIAIKVIRNLYTPDTIDQCYINNSLDYETGLRNSSGERNIVGNTDRILYINEEKLEIFSKLFNRDKYEEAYLLDIQSNKLLEILSIFSNKSKKIKQLFDNKSLFMNELWDEKKDRINGTIISKIDFPESLESTVYSSPHISVSNPLFQSVRPDYAGKNDFDALDISSIPEYYLPRCIYSINKRYEDVRLNGGLTPWGEYFMDQYRIVLRRRTNPIQERTFNCSIIPPKVSFIRNLTGISFRNQKDVVKYLSMWSSLPYDFLIKIIAKDISADNLSTLPVIEDTPLLMEMCFRTLKLVSITKYYSELTTWFNFDNMNIEWTKKDNRLSPQLPNCNNN